MEGGPASYPKFDFWRVSVSPTLPSRQKEIRLRSLASWTASYFSRFGWRDWNCMPAAGSFLGVSPGRAQCLTIAPNSQVIFSMKESGDLSMKLWSQRLEENFRWSQSTNSTTFFQHYIDIRFTLLDASSCTQMLLLHVEAFKTF